MAAKLQEPGRDCARCPRLAAFRENNRKAHRDWHNAPVPSFVPVKSSGPVRLLIVGLAPGLKGANRTGRPFTGDYAGDILYPALLKHGFAAGKYAARADDGLRLLGCRITNAVRCVPPANKPTPAEAAACCGFLEAEIRSLPDLEIVLALGRVAHEQTLVALGLRKSAMRFRHGALNELGNGLPALADSYHCSRYNLNTGRLTAKMFDGMMAAVRRRLDVR